MLLAGLDGIKKKMDPTALGYGPFDKNIYEMSDAEKKEIRSVPSSLEDALNSLEADSDFLTADGVFSKDFLANYIEFKRAEAKAVNIRIHPHEYSLYFGC